MKKKLFLLLIIVGISGSFLIMQSQNFVPNHPIYPYTVKTIDGIDKTLDEFRGKVVLIVNVASKCGYTSQYKGLQELYENFNDHGLEILGFPCNQFRGQEPGTNKEIKEFCSTEYGVTFPMFSKIEVNGPDAHPLFQYLTAAGQYPIKWNFEKFLVDKNGVLIKRYGTKTEPKELEKDIQELLSQTNY